ncbi:MAG TPA: hypothetical protein VGR95_18395 [Thermoanaerobaculia bacterium]|jgi:hypothetical protein|nr:hypothetical protein [Thermoanaerobaculia bacterium]
MGNPLEDTFTFALDRVERWWASLWDMSGVAARLLAENVTNAQRVRAVASLWFSSLFLAILVTLPAYSYYGLKLDNLSFQLSYMLLQYVVLLSFSWALHKALQLHGVKSNYAETLTLYSVITAALAPVLVLVALPGNMHLLGIVSAAKAGKAGPLAAMYQTVTSFNNPNNGVWQVLAAALGPPLIALSCIVMGATIRMFATHYSCEEWSVARAFACAMMVILPIPFVLASAVGFSIYYVFVT